MISKYLSSEKIIDQVPPILDSEKLQQDTNSGYVYLNQFDYRSDIYLYNNLFNESELDKIVSIGNRLKEESAYVSGNDQNGVDIEIRTSKVSWIPVNDITEWIYTKIINCIHEVNNDFYSYELDKLEKLQFTKYFGSEKGFYTKHIDTMSGVYPHNRKLTFVLQLSDPSNYTGGELQIHNSKDPQIIEKRKGLLTFFSSYTLHECTPVISGERYTLVGWIHGPRFR